MGANLKKEGSENTGDATSSNIPTEYKLEQNYPNPFNPSTEIKYQLPQDGYVKIEVFDILGNSITTLVDQDMQAGYHSVTWNASNLASGIYFYRIQSGTFTAIKKLMLMK